MRQATSEGGYEWLRMFAGERDELQSEWDLYATYADRGIRTGGWMRTESIHRATPRHRKGHLSTPTSVSTEGVLEGYNRLASH